MNNAPLVSICCLTYNHVNYIKEAIEGFLMQKTSFTFEIIIHDDASTDNTAKIIQEYEKQYPKIIRPIYQTENQYSKNPLGIYSDITFPLARGKYIAICEGDDYWTDPYKLQKQVDFMEAHTDCSACFTNALLINEITESQRSYVKLLVEGYVSDQNIIIKGGGLYPTASLLFRADLFKPEFFTGLIELPDDTLLIYNMLFSGKIFFMNQITCVYRRWTGGVYSGIRHSLEQISRLKIMQLEGYYKIDKLSCKKYHKIFRRKISFECLYIIRHGKGIQRIKYLARLVPKDLIRLILGMKPSCYKNTKQHENNFQS